MTPEVLEQHNLTEAEYDRILSILGRPPNLTELGIFSVMWSEHCSYKSSKLHLKRLPTQGPQVLQGPGENAGIVDIGDGYAVAFKIESHNHPSFVEPYQGAATGVGGILRDIFTMGARPIAAMNSLRFGPPDQPRNRRIMEGVVAGIAGYGNCFGVPTVGGEVVFGECYSQNPLVNAFALGLFRKDRIFYGKAVGIGNPVLYVGSKTGRDGIHGATMASAEFDEASESKRPNVQVGDPFLEKLLLEACLESMKTGAVVGIQDMGAAGLTCSTCEMGGRADTGIEIDLAKVPQREQGMTPYEIMLSESQERMLLVAERGREEEILRIFRKWEIDAVTIGKVTRDGMLRILDRGKKVAEIPNRALTDEAPVYRRPVAAPAPPSPEPAPPSGSLSLDWGKVLECFLGSPNLSSREWVYRQYDHMVRTNTVQAPGADAAVVRVKNTRKALAMSLDGNGRYCRQDPRVGAQLSVAESCRNLVCAGARPLAATNCLNLGNPEKPEIMWQVTQVVEGIAEACRALETPITGGNVSLYNETLGEGIDPTPVIGMVGLIEPLSRLRGSWFLQEGHRIVLLGPLVGQPTSYSSAVRRNLAKLRRLQETGGDVYTRWVRALPCPPLDLDLEVRVQRTCREGIENGLILSAHDCSEGGLAVALAEMGFSRFGGRTLGAEIRLPAAEEVGEVLFAEYPSRILVTVETENLAALERIAALQGVPVTFLGQVVPEVLSLRSTDSTVIEKSMVSLEETWRNCLGGLFADPL
ncbi:Phosphoribosylformylglycinamidine synthase subunit PurL [Geodia barretti]|uniref:Phosphoribosylformylglycinamidine synthase subunit PurL n=2 Tax=Geodia barretti TaxID=519541 RepID=A0AA35R3C4_GEOBA|nr:Phosphoribosylformylglycinamidine synthase subunit PurL [Geodia barretti]